MNERIDALEKLYDKERLKAQFLFGVLKKTLSKKPHSCKCANEPNKVLQLLQKEFMRMDLYDDLENLLIFKEYWSKFEEEFTLMNHVLK